MTGGAVELVEQYKALDYNVDLILATDMLDLSAFLAMAKIDKQKIKTALYFHENQITYPWNTKDDEAQKEKNHHYGFINFTSCLSADKIYFNSNFHKNSFIHTLPAFLKIFPSFGHQKYIDEISSKSQVLSIGLNLQSTNAQEKNSTSTLPCFLWNHRWEHDKNPEVFFNTLYQLKENQIAFELIVLGKSYARQPPIFAEAKEHLKDEIIHFGYVESAETYQQLLDRANILLVTSNQDFFGISIVEAISSGLYPILPYRLAYPEHIAKEKVDDVFYLNDDQLLPLVKRIIENGKYQFDSGCAYFVQKYDWTNLIEHYDYEFSKLMKL